MKTYICDKNILIFFFCLLVIKDLESRNICTDITTKLEQFLMDTKQVNQVFHEEKSTNRGSWAG